MNASPSAPSFTQPSTVNGFAATSANTFNNAFLPSVEPAVEQKPPSNAFATVPSPPNRQSSLNDSQTSNKPPTFDDAFGSLSSRVSTIASSTDPGKPPAFNDAFGSLSSGFQRSPLREITVFRSTTYLEEEPLKHLEIHWAFQLRAHLRQRNKTLDHHFRRRPLPQARQVQGCLSRDQVCARHRRLPGFIASPPTIHRLFVRRAVSRRASRLRLRGTQS